MAKKTALVVDDSSFIRTLHSSFLKKLSFETQVVVNGKEAVDLLLASGNKSCFDLILMDRDMPLMNGIEATRRLREMGVRSMIIGVSSRDTGEEKLEFMEAGLQEYVEKPLAIARLESIVQRSGEGHAVHDELHGGGEGVEAVNKADLGVAVA